jgi:hypothetical protein
MTKGQSAIEYLMTYGWMLLVVAIVGGLIFTLAQDQDVEEVVGFDGQQIIVENFGVTSDNNLSLEVTNARTGTAEIKNVTVEDDDGRVAFKDYQGSGFEAAETAGEPLELGSQESVEIRVPEFSRNDTAQSFQVEISFDRAGLTDIVSDGRITGGLRME